MGGKSSSANAGYKYYAGFQMVFARYIHKLLRIRVDKKLAWSGQQTSEGIININVPNLFGAPGSADPEGGIVGNVNFQPGLPTQSADSYMAGKIGAAIPASRGVSALVGHQIYLGNNPYMKDWDVRAERIHQFDDGSAQWYDAKAAIPNSLQAEGDFITLFAKLDLDANIMYGQATNPGHTIAITGRQATDVLRFTVLNSGTGATWIAWSRYPYPVGASGSNWSCAFTVTDSAGTRHSFYEDGSYGPPWYFPTPEEAEAYVAAQDPVTITGSTSYHVDLNDYITQDNQRGLSLKIEYAPGAVQTYDMNPAHMLRECLTNAEWGYGYDASDLDDSLFTAMADTLFTEGLGLSYFWDDANTEIGDVIENILAHVDAQLYVDRRTQLWSPILIRDDYDVATLPEFAADVEIISMEDFARPGFMDLVNEITVSYYNPALSQSSTITLPNSALFLQQGVKINQQNDYSMCCSSSIASRLCSRDLRTESTPLASGTVYLIPTDETNALHRGSVCKLTFPKYSLYSTVVRVTSISFGDGSSKRIKMTFTEDVFALPDTIVTAEPPSGWVDPGSVPSPVLHQLLEEVPYAYLLKTRSQSDLDAALTNDSGLGYLGCSAARPGNALSANLYVDSGSGYQTNAIVDFCGYGQLVADLGYLDTAFDITNTSDFSEAGSNTFFQIDNEIMAFVSAYGNSLSGVVRGLFDTVAASHSAGADVFFIENYLDSDLIEYGSGESVNVKLTPKATKGTLFLADATIAAMTFASRASAPYPPGKPQIGGVDYPTAVSGAFVVTWAHRNRITQATQFVDTTMGSVTPEVNTRYGLRFLDATDTLIVEQTNIGPATASVVLNYTGNVTMQLYSITDNGRSIQQHEFTFAYTPPSGTVVTAITATAYTPVDTSTIIDGGGA